MLKRLSLVLFLTSSATVAENDFSKNRQLCFDTNLKYAKYVDLGEAKLASELFTKDAIFQYEEKIINGRNEIYNELSKRLNNLAITRVHVVSNHLIWANEQRLSGSSYFTLYRGNLSKNTIVTPVSQLTVVGVFEDDYSIVKGRCLISHRRGRPLVKTLKKIQP